MWLNCAATSFNYLGALLGNASRGVGHQSFIDYLCLFRDDAERFLPTRFAPSSS